MQESSEQSSSQYSHHPKVSPPCSSLDLQGQASSTNQQISVESHISPFTDTQTFTPIRNLNPRLTNCKIGVAVTRTWEVNTVNVSTWNFIVIDSEGDQIHGKVSKSTYGKFANVIGVFNHLSEFSRKKEIAIYNEQGETVSITFWDSTVPINPSDFQMMRDKIIVVTITTVKDRDDTIYLTGTKGTKTYLDPDIPAAHELRQSLAQKGSVVSKKRLLNISNVQTIDYIQYMVTREVAESYTCRATIIQVYHNQGWSYMSCVQCKKKLKLRQTKSPTWCDKCNKFVSQSILRVLIHFRVKDNAGELNLTAFEEVATKLIGKTRDELITLDHCGGKTAVDAQLDEMVGNEYCFRVKISYFNILHQGQSLTTISASPTEPLNNKRLKIGN